MNSSGDLAKGSRASGEDQVNAKDQQGENLLVNVSKFSNADKDFIQSIMNAKLFFRVGKTF